MIRTRARWARVFGLALALVASPAAAADQQQPANPVGATKGWTTRVAPAPGETPATPPAAAPTEPAQAPAAPTSLVQLTPEQIALIQRISAYFNSLESLEGNFVQVNPNKQSTSGKFYVQRPGLLRFDYAAPSRLRVVADGRYLSIEDHDLKTVDQFPLDATPFRLLLSADVDLIRDAVIIDFTHSDNVASLTLEDKNDGSRGRLQLFFTLPEIELKEWVVTDPQGLDTRIQIADLVTGQEREKEFFKSSALDFIDFDHR